MRASMKWRIIFAVASPHSFCCGVVGDDGREAAMDVREVALPTRISM